MNLSAEKSFFTRETSTVMTAESLKELHLSELLTVVPRCLNDDLVALTIARDIRGSIITRVCKILKSQKSVFSNNL